MTLKRLLQACFMLFIAINISMAASAQDKVITGKVTDSKDGSPVSGATVVPKGSTSTGTTTGSDGTFRLSVAPNVTAIVISYVGFGTQEVSISGKTNVDVSLASTGSNLNEVIVVGYGTARKKDLTGAVASVRAKDFNKGIQPAPDQLIQGKVAGVQVVSNSGAPGGGTTVRIRGTSSIRSDNSPLWVVDGVPLSNTNSRPDIGLSDVGGGSPSGNPLNFISPSDIASMEVLKDASAAAIYGSRGSNGVILITTKKGQSGAPKVELNASVGVSNILKQLEVLDGNEYRTALGEYGFPTNVNAPGNPSANFGSNVDALDAVLRTGITQNYGVSVSSGTDAAKYRLSLGALNQEGIINKTDFKKYTANFSSQFKLLNDKRLGLDFNILTSQTTEHVAPISNSAGFKGSLIGQALQWNPTRSLRNADGTPFVEFGSDNINPLAYSEAYFDEPKVTTILANISPSYKITPNLEYRMLVSVNYSTGVRKQYTTSNININDVARAFSASRNDTIGGEANVSSNELLTSQITNTLSYVKDINPNFSINTVIGHEYLKTDFSGNSDYARGFLRLPLALYTIMPTSDPSTRRTNSFEAITTELQSFFGRAIVNIKDKYLLTGTIRADGSSKFGENNRYGYFPSLAAAWSINKESFFEDVSVVNNLKLRASWGITGNQEFPAGASQTLYTLTGSNPASIAQSQFANPDLKWESTTTINFGVDFTVWNNRLSGSLDWFNRATEDLLFPREAADPVTPNGAIQWQNIPGTLTNKGFEIALNVNIIRGTDWNWDLGVVTSFLDNKLTDFGALQIPIGEVNGQGLSGAYAQLLVNDQPLNSFYLKKFIGIDKTTGVSIYEGGEEKFFLGSPNPETLLGFTTNVSWKKLSLEVAMNGAFGHYLYNNTANAVTSFNNLGKRNIGVRELGIAKSVGEQPVNPTSASSRYLEKGDFMKLSNATLSYNIGAIGKNIRSANVFVTGQNLFVLTDFSGFDPEVNTSKTLNNIPSFGMEYTPYPTARTFNFGVNFSF